MFLIGCFYEFCFMIKLAIINLLFVLAFCFLGLISSPLHSQTVKTPDSKQDSLEPLNIYEKRLQFLNENTPMDLSYNKKVEPFIENYLGRNKGLISRMQGLKELYFPLFEQELDKYGLPLEFKYLAIVESALNPRAKSSSGATGLWQFMYLTGKEYGLKVTSYVDERQDPLKSTQAACEYFKDLYYMFGDWNLVLAAYNGGPGYLQRKINSVGSYNFWEIYPHLRKETRNYIPTFIAVNYAMNYCEEHEIESASPDINATEVDTIKIKKQISLTTLSRMLCLNKQTINYFNPSYKKDIFPKNSILRLPCFAIDDFLNNEQSNYLFVDAVEAKEILIDEERVVYNVREGDYLGKIAKEYGVKIFELKEWNSLTSTDLDVGEKLIIYVKNNQEETKEIQKSEKNMYVIKKGDTLWGIAQKYEGLSVWKIRSLNNLEGDYLKPGTKIILPKT